MSAIMMSLGAAGSSPRSMFRRILPASHIARRAICSTPPVRDVTAELEKQLNPREIIERKRKQFEEKYGDKLKQKVRAEGVDDLEALKIKVMAPSVRSALKSRPRPKDPVRDEEVRKASEQLADGVDRKRPAKKLDPDAGDAAGIKPLSSILNLPLLHLTPHDAEAISKIWTTYHLAHPTLSSSYLSASLPSGTYDSMLRLARENPFFVLPLPRDQDATTGAVKTDEYEMFYLQWLFHPTPSSTAPPTPGSATTELPPTTSIIFTPLEEFKKSGEWASPFLVLTHYPDLSQSHDLVLMRGEITAQAATGPIGSLANPGWLLSQQQGQLLALALQRFYCSDIAPRNETAQSSADRGERRQALKGFRENPGDWDWTRLVSMAYGGMV